jgi:hypothetical protein
MTGMGYHERHFNRASGDIKSGNDGTPEKVACTARSVYHDASIQSSPDALPVNDVLDFCILCSENY